MAKHNPLRQWSSTCGPQKYFVVGHRAVWFEKVVFAQWAVYSLTLSESLQKVAVNGELTCFFCVWRSPVFNRKNRLNFDEDLFFLRSPVFGRKNHFNLIKNWCKFGSSSLTDVSSFQPPLQNAGYATAQDSGKLQLSNTLRVGPWKTFKTKMGHG